LVGFWVVGAGVGGAIDVEGVGAGVGESVGGRVGALDGEGVGCGVGEGVGARVGALDGEGVGCRVGEGVGADVGAGERAEVVGVGVTTFGAFLQIATTALVLQAAC
jgi:hypothetical protein